ncbi:hypothetical protein [Streptomyces sp. NPDC059786]|uniref:hypothetical protein n=1 Tax=Streptomyces sp. NPDC059786 TaxID=3346946 RepID=UPI00364C8D7A
MSAQEERDALTPPTALYDHALRLLRKSPGEVPPLRGYLVPQKTTGTGHALLGKSAQSALREALTPLPGDPATLHRRFERLGIEDRDRHLIKSTVAELPLPADQVDRARALGRRLVRTGTTVPAVTVGIVLLGRLGGPEDIPYLRALGLFRELTAPAVAALDTLDRQAAAVVWLALHARRDELRPLVHALWTGDRQAVRTELVVFPASARLVDSTTARRIAEASRLPDLLGHHPHDVGLLARAGRLLVRMGCSRDDPTDLLGYRDAVRVYDTVVGRAAALPPTLDNAAMLLSLALDLSSGTGMLLDRPPGRRAALLETLGRLLAESRWTRAGATANDADHPDPPDQPGDTTYDADQRRRAEWFHRTRRQPSQQPAAPGRFRIEVVAGDPEDRGPVETRVLIDGRPVVAAAFCRGPAHAPEYLLDDHRLRAAAEPHEVQLAEAHCTEGCCGAIYVTIRRDADQVVWENWRQTVGTPAEPALEPTAYRFDASAYDAEVARAETDGSWSWRARTVARLIRGGLAERPDLLNRWDAEPGWVSSGFEDPDTAVVNFRYAPGLASGDPERDDSPLHFRWDIPDDGTPPESQAAAALHRLAEEDPKRYARVCGGSRERAAELGFPWPDDVDRRRR